MATVTYNGVRLEVERTANLTAEPVYDRAGVGYLYTHIVFEAECIYSPFATAANRNAGAPDTPGRMGDSLGKTLKAWLTEKLNAPHKQLIIDLGPDNVITAPQVDKFPGVTSDCNNGPQPMRGIAIMEIDGDYAAIVRFGIECWISDCDKIVLSNRWHMRTSTTVDAFTTRVIIGEAVLRTDLMRLAGVNADNFRSSYFMPCPPQFKRDLADGVLSDDGARLQYMIVDREQPLALGASGVGGRSVTRIIGTATAGSVTDTGMWAQTLHESSATLWNVGLNFVPYLGVTAAVVSLLGLSGNMYYAYSRIATNRAAASVRAYGNPNALVSDLVKVAAAVCMERLRVLNPARVLGFFGGGGGGPTVLTAMATQGIGGSERWAQVEISVLSRISSKVATTSNIFDFEALMVLNNSVVGDKNTVDLDLRGGEGLTPKGDGPVLPYADNSRGWQGALFAQLLGNACALPADVPKGFANTRDLSMR